MKNKTHLTLVSTTPATQLPMESADDFKRWVLVDGIKPSVALRKMMEKYNCPKLDVSIPIQLVELTYPDLNLSRGGFQFRMVDAAYPNSDPNQFSDQDFDDGIENLRVTPYSW